MRKLSGKFHFVLRFCTRKRSKTYIYKYEVMKISPGCSLTRALVPNAFASPPFESADSSDFLFNSSWGLSVPTTQGAFIFKQNHHLSVQPTSRNFWAKSQKWPVMWLLRSTNKRNVIGVTYIIFTWIEIVRFSWIFNSLPYNQCNVKDWMEQKSSVLWESDKSLNMNYGQFKNSVLLPLPC